MNLNLYSVTWNTNARPPLDTIDWLSLFGLGEKTTDVLPDLISIGFQEVSFRLDNLVYENLISGEDPWTAAARSSLGSFGYVKLKTIRMLGIVLSVFCLRKHLSHVRLQETQYTRLGAYGLGLKGCVSFRLALYGVSICFINSHLSAHDHHFERRVQEYEAIVRTHTFNVEMTKNIFYHDYIIWAGDLNFRLDSTDLSHQDIVQKISEGKLEELFQMDQLTAAMKKELAFSELHEIRPNFPPTYKLNVGTQNYNTERKPAWTDRILYCVNSSNYEEILNLEMTQENYQSHSSSTFHNFSDHLPVSSLFKIVAFDEDKAKSHSISDYGPLIKFSFPAQSVGQEPLVSDVNTDEEYCWYSSEECVIKYTVETNAGLYLNQWDYIMLYKENFTSLEDYVAYCWASNSRRTGLQKVCVMSDSSYWTPGNYVLVYLSASKSVLGVSNSFPFKGPRSPTLEEGVEVHED